MINNEYCVFTTLIGNYEALNEQEVANESEIDFICFTDNKKLKSETWKIKIIDPVLPFDSVRTAKSIKMCAHNYLGDYKTSLYIDNSVMLRVIPEIIFNDFPRDDFDMYCFEHSFRETLLEEYETVLKYDYDKPNIIFEQLNTYSMISPGLFLQKPYWGGFLIRNHTTPSVINAMEDWLIQIMRYSRRDQLSLNYVLNKHALKFKSLKIDNRQSKYHNWPTAIRYGEVSLQQSLLTNIESNLRANAQRFELEKMSEQVREKEEHIEKLKAQINYYSESKSWLITKPLRSFFSIFRDSKEK